jgi:N-acetylglutamate synthase-like GNAT family acetyltransferase
MNKYADISDISGVSELDPHVTLDALSRAVEEHRVMVSTNGGAIIGVVRFNFFWDSIPFLNMLYVAETWQNRGVGSSLLELWEREMKSQGYGRVFTSTMASERGQYFFRKHGYTDIGCLWDDGFGLELILEKRL